MAISDSGGGTIDVVDFIDRQPIGGFQIHLLLTCAAVLFLDGFDTQAIGYVAPALAKEWSLTKAALGPVFSAGLFGLMIGALVFGPLADRVGRKKIIIFSTAAFGLGALATAFVQDVNTLLVIRFLTGLGLGGAMPNAIAHDVGVQSAAPPRHHGHDHVLRLLDRRGARRPARGGPDPALRLALGVHRRRHRAAVAGAGTGAGGCRNRCVSCAHRPATRRSASRELLKRISPNSRLRAGARFVVHEAHLAGHSGRCICSARGGPP